MKPIMAIFIHDPQCETECALGMIDAFVHDFDIRTFGLAELNYRFLSGFDVIAFPGGMGDADDFDEIFNSDHVQSVQDYVQDGGKYFGICMGAYWAGPDYFAVTTDLTLGQYIERSTANIDTDGPTVAEVTWLGQLETMYFYDGCAILGDYMQVVARYQNGDAMAVIQGNVGIIGCHPEALSWWYSEGEMPDYYSPRHALLMRDFAKHLVKA